MVDDGHLYVCCIVYKQRCLAVVVFSCVCLLCSGRLFVGNLYFFLFLEHATTHARRVPILLFFFSCLFLTCSGGGGS